MSTALFYVSKWPSRDLLLDAVKYGDDPVRKFRVEFTVRHHTVEKTVKLSDVEVLGFQRIIHSRDIGWVKLTLRLHEPFEYLDHVFREGVIYMTLALRSPNRSTEGTVGLTEESS